MKTTTTHLLIIALASLLLAGCSNDNPLAPFEPEIVTEADAFQFQVTDAKDVTVTRSYVWSNAAGSASIDHSTKLTDGSATVVVLDGTGTEVYRSALKASGTEQSQSGAAGEWTVMVIMSGFDGSANFRVEPK